jgi:hypothetical protein
LKIDKLSKQIEVKLLHYQDLRSKSKLMADEFPEATFGDIINHSSNFWKSLDLTIDDDFNIPRIVMYNSIQHFNNFKRAEEETNLIPIEIDRLFKFWVNQKLEIEKRLQQYKKTSDDLFKVNVY